MGRSSAAYSRGRRISVELLVRAIPGGCILTSPGWGGAARSDGPGPGIFLKVFQRSIASTGLKVSTWLFRSRQCLHRSSPQGTPPNGCRSIADPEGPGTVPPEQRSAGLDALRELRNVERGKAISEAIQELPPDFRELIALRHFAGLSYEEIAEVKKLPLGTVKNTLFRARVVLKERLSGEVT